MEDKVTRLLYGRHRYTLLYGRHRYTVDIWTTTLHGCYMEDNVTRLLYGRHRYTVDIWKTS